MDKHMVALLTAVGAVLSLALMASSAAGEMMFDQQHYRDLVDASSSQTIPLGTKITLRNWLQYKNFMPVWLQAAYSGDYHWHIGSGPEFTIVVGPTSNFSLPKKFWRIPKSFTARLAWRNSRTADSQSGVTQPECRFPTPLNPILPSS